VDGFYIGGNAGGGLGNAVSNFGVGARVCVGRQFIEGAVAGGQLGYNCRAGPWSMDWRPTPVQHRERHAVRAVRTRLCGVALTASYSQEVSWFGTV